MTKAKQIDWRKAYPAPIVLLFGPESFISSKTTREIRDQLRAKHPNLEISEVEADSYASGQLLNLASPSLFAEPRLIIVDGAERCTDAFIEDAKSYNLQPAEDTYLIVRHSGSSVRGKVFLEAFRSNPAAIEIACAKIDKDADRVKFVVSEFATAQRKVTEGAIRALTDAFTGDIGELAGACQQLMLDSAETIGEEIVDRYFGGRVQTNSFKIADAALAGKLNEALALLRHGFNTGLDPVPLLAGMATKIRTMARVHSDPRATPASTGLDPWRLSKARSDVQGWNDEELGQALQLLASADAAAKGAAKDPEYQIEKLVSFLATKGRTR